MKPLLTFFFSFFLLFSTSAQEIEIRFDHYAILAQNLDASSNFYMEVMGLKEIEDKTELPHIRWFSMGNNTELHIIENKDYSAPDEIGVHFALRVNDLNAFMKKIVDRKIEFQNWFGLVGRTNARPDGVRQIYLQDPNGYWIEVNGE